jgi:uncharacterized membrane protein
MTLTPANRIESIDLLKGIVMVVMALDHTRDYFHETIHIADLTDPALATAPVFFTRWITHFCAPTFSFLAGISAFMVGRRKTKSELTAFLLKRGLWLVFIEVTVVSFAWYFDLRFRNIDLAVIWSLGISMLFLAAVIRLPPKAILVISLVIICGHNLLDAIPADGNIWWSILHEEGAYQVSDNLTINVFYPIIPWMGVMSLGYFFGGFYQPSFGQEKRRKLFNVVGLAAIISFFVIRWINIYGDPGLWKMYPDFMATIFSFLNITKYPPSLLFLCLTLGAALLFLANSEHFGGRVVRFFTVYGRVPFFYYILHLYLIHALAMLAAELTGFGWESMVMTSSALDKEFGVPLIVVYLLWISIVLSLYPLCHAFDLHKTENKTKVWLSYL